MQQISFTVPNQEMLEKILLTLSKMDSISDLQVSSSDETVKEQIVPAKRTAGSFDEMLADWTDMKETAEIFRDQLWKTKSF